MSRYRSDENILALMSMSTAHVHKVTFAMMANTPRPKTPKNFLQTIADQYAQALENKPEDSTVLIGQIGDISEVRKLTTNVGLAYNPMFILWTITELETGRQVTASTIHDLYMDMLAAFGEVPVLSLIDIASYMRPGDELSLRINNHTYVMEVSNG